MREKNERGCLLKIAGGKPCDNLFDYRPSSFVAFCAGLVQNLFDARSERVLCIAMPYWRA